MMLIGFCGNKSLLIKHFYRKPVFIRKKKDTVRRAWNLQESWWYAKTVTYMFFVLADTAVGQEQAHL